jgi:hypothetical protein
MKDAGRDGKAKYTEIEFLRTIQEALVSTYRDVLREPLPPGIKEVLARLTFGDTYLLAKQQPMAARNRGS